MWEGRIAVDNAVSKCRYLEPAASWVKKYEGRKLQFSDRGHYECCNISTLPLNSPNCVFLASSFVFLDERFPTISKFSDRLTFRAGTIPFSPSHNAVY